MEGWAELFEMSLRAARGEGEGEAWNEALARDVGLRVGKLLFAAARREAARWAAEAPEGLNLPQNEARAGKGLLVLPRRASGAPCDESQKCRWACAQPVQRAPLV